MELSNREKSVAELKKEKQFLATGWIITTVILALAMLKIVAQSDIIIERTPGMPSESRLEKTAIDKSSQRAILWSVTAAIVQVNPENAQYQKEFIYPFLAPAMYTRIVRDIDASVAQLEQQHELGSYYMVLRNPGYLYDPVLDRHFVICDVHTVNAAKDTAEPYVYEYKTHVENYRLVIDSVSAYPGDKPHTSSWLKDHKS